MKLGELAGKIGGRTHVVVDHGVTTQQEARAGRRAAVAEQIGSAAYEATGSPSDRPCSSPVSPSASPASTRPCPGSG